MEAWSHHMLSTAQMRAADLDDSRANSTEALLIFHRFGDVAGITLTLDDFASLAIAAVQFHPESVMTSPGEIGMPIIEQALALLCTKATAK